MLLPNNENLKIEITESCSITVNDYDYCQFQNATIEEIDIDNLVNWIENTYYDNSYMSSAYISPDLNIEEFRVKN